MERALRLLHVEDSLDDAELLRIALESTGYMLHYRRMESAAEVRSALAEESWDAVISDYNLPSLDAYEVLHLLQASGHDIPLIIVSGFIGEEGAVALMKAGAHDYVMKDNLARLAPAIEREIKEAAGREQRRQADREAQESRRQLQELSAFLQQVREDERTRIARELHDELGQALTALRIDLNWLDARLPQREQKVGDKLSAMLGLVDKTVDAIRRISEDLRPGMLDDLGLAAAIEHHAAKFAEQTGVTCEVSISHEHYVLDDRIATALFRVLQESLTNVARHAQARRAAVLLEQDGGTMRLVVTDDGCGLPQLPSAAKKTYGLLGMHERVKLLGGKLDISSAPGRGTRIDVRVPIESQG